MARIFPTEHFGDADIVTGHYHEGKALAVSLLTPFGEPIAKLSVNVPGKREQLPANCFFCKDWSENDLIIRDAANSGWFIPRLDLEPAICGFEMAWVWELRETQSEPFDYDNMLEE